MTLQTRKIFVLDTNVILHDSSCIYQFDAHDVVIPITVLEELDRFKRGKEIINCNAREFVRSLDALTGEKLFNGGVAIGPGRGKISICLERELHEDLRESFSGAKPDHHILNTAYHLAEKHHFEGVVLVTKDVNLRMKAKSVGLMAEDYTTDRVGDIGEIYKGRRTVEAVPGAVIDRLFEEPFDIRPGDVAAQPDFHANEFLILRNGSKSGLGMFDRAADRIRRVENRVCFGIKGRNVEQFFAMNALLDRNIPLVTLSGKAGTGKTLLALAAALENKRYYRQILIARPTVPLSNRDLGYLPGDINSKLDPYLQPLFDNLSVIQNQFPPENPRHSAVREYLDEEKIVIAPLSYIRGRSIVKAFFIVDEAQNLTPHEVKTIITRAGEGTKIVFSGDIFQIDHPYLDSQTNGLSYLIEKMKGQPLYAHINLEKGERSELSELASSLL
ncbi:MAG: PhoH family protein [Desulfobacterales bacterium]|jgi:PhoH-like ATPase|nr:PhoH family protein [Desulfobacterales bacterium]